MVIEYHNKSFISLSLKFNMAGETLDDEQEIAYNYSVLIVSSIKELEEVDKLPAGGYKGTPEDWCKFLGLEAESVMDVMYVASGLEELAKEGKLKSVHGTKQREYAYESPEHYEAED